MGENGDTFAPAAERRVHPRKGRLATTTWSRSFHLTEACFKQNWIAAVGRPRVLFARDSFPSSTTAQMLPSSSKAAEVSWVKEDKPRMRMAGFPHRICSRNQVDKSDRHEGAPGQAWFGKCSKNVLEILPKGYWGTS